MNARLLARVGTIAALAATALVGAAGTAQAVSTVEDCLAAKPGAVTTTEVTPGDDLVCLTSDDMRIASEGDDTYLWVGGTSEGTDTIEGDVVDDPGTDTASMEMWEGPWIDGDHADPNSNVLGNRWHIHTERFTFTPFADTLGDPDNCSGVLGNGGLTYDMDDGSDTVRCVAATILAGEGADTVRGVADGGTVQAGPGADHVIGDLDADVISLGAGADTATVVEGAVDRVFGGDGSDVVRASSNDLLFSARMFAAPAPAPQPVVKPRFSTSVGCERGVTVRTLRLDNRASNVAVDYRLAVRRPSGRIVRDTVRVGGDAVRTREVRVGADRATAKVSVRAAGDLLWAGLVRGARCSG
jgi:Ca2+-binding RTX toxin-like protein